MGRLTAVAAADRLPPMSSELLLTASALDLQAGQRLARLCFAKNPATLDAAIARLQAL